MGFLLSFFALVMFSAFYLLVDHSQKKKGDPMGLNLMTFCFGGLLSVLATGGISFSRFPPHVLEVGSLIGLTASAGLLGVTLAVRCGTPISVANTVMGLALVIPILLAVAFYGETPGPRQAVGLVFAGLSIFLIQYKR